MTNFIANRVAFTIFGVDIYWYGVIISTAILIAFLIAFALCKRKGHSSNVPYEIIIAILPLGILSARLFDVLFDKGLSITDYFKFREGGMSIIGAILGGLVGLALLRLIRKRNFLEMADILVVVLILAQGIGRWGNYFNEEVYGQIVTNPSFQHFPLAVLVDGQWYEALFFYESVLDILGFVMLINLYWFTKPRGVCTGTYLVYYGIIRFFLEPRRQQQYILGTGSLMVSRLMSLFMIIAGLAILIYVIVTEIRSKRGKNGKEQEVLHTN